MALVSANRVKFVIESTNLSDGVKSALLERLKKFLLKSGNGLVERGDLFVELRDTARNMSAGDYKIVGAALRNEGPLPIIDPRKIHPETRPS